MSAPAAAIPAEKTLDIDAHRWWILLGLITAAIMEVLDTTIINVALPRMAGNLGATQQEITWVSTCYILANVVVLPMTAFFTARFGRKRYLTFSIILFVVASFLCGTSSSLTELVIWRLLQGAGGAALLSTAQATLRQIFPKEEQALVQSVFLLGVIMAPTLGPTLGGWITDNYTWNWCFFINIPIGLAATFLVTTFLHDPVDMKPVTTPVDWTGIVLLIVGIGSLQFVLEEGNRRDWFADQLILELSVLSAVSLVTMVWWQLSKRNKFPVIDFHVLNNRDLAVSIFLFIVLGFGLYGGTILYPLFTQGILGFTPTETGLSMMPGGIATGIMAMACGIAMNPAKPRADGRVLILCGMVVMLISMWTLGHLTTSAGERDTIIALILRGAALGLLFAPINYVAYASLDLKNAQQASGLINLARQLGGSFGIAILVSFLTHHVAVHRADLVTNMVPGSPVFDQHYQALVGSFMQHGGSPVEAQKSALTVLDGQVMRQASMLAYNDCWMLILVCFAAVAPAVFLLRKPKKGAAPAPAGH